MALLLSTDPLTRFCYAVGVAFVIHVVLLLAVSFKPLDEVRQSSRSMEVTLAQYADQSPPEQADFLAQASQQGSGTLEEKAELTAVEPSLAPADQVQAVAPPVSKPVPPVKRPDPEVVTVKNVEASQQVREPAPEAEPPEDPFAMPAPDSSLMARSLEIASLEARLSQQMQAYAGRPKITRLTAASTMKSSDAFYLKSWLEKVERVGNLNYPDEARRKKIYGRLRLLVALWPNGEVKEIKILKSSGHALLDDAAERIVRLAAPFSPFPEEMRRETDILEIIRTWTFQQRGLSS